MSTAPSPDFVALQSALRGRYSIERELGRGGMGVVYLAHEVALDRPVALKLLPPELAARPDLRERFLREARTAARLSHPHIIPIFTVEEVGDFVFFAMAYVRGETLGERVRRRGPLSNREAVRLLQETAWALAYAHAQGVVHQDVKPDNVLIDEGSGRALVTDFGIARVVQGSGAEGGALIAGTPEVMSPEQARGGAVDGRSDVYSLGVLGFYALTGRFPFEGPSAPAVLARHLEEPPPPVASRAPGVSARLAGAVDRCLRKDPEERFPSGEALAEAIGQSVPAERQLPVALRVFLNRNREVYRFGVGTALLVVVFTPSLIAAALPGSARAAVLLSAFLSLTLLPPIGSLLYQARKLLAAGYGLDDLRLAFRQEHERRKEELAFEFGARPSRTDRILAVASYASLGVAAAVTAVLMGFPAAAEVAALWGALGISATAGMAVGAVATRRQRRRRDVAGERWLRFWNGRLGRWLFGAAGVGLRRPDAAGVVTYRPTELAIGLAADRLFERLPRAARRSLQGLTETIRSLERDARRLRERLDELNRLLAEIGEGTGRAGSEERARLRADLEGTRDAVQASLTEVVAALETIRLGLLRLHAGTDSVESVTLELSAARDLSEDLGHLLAGQREVESLLGK